MSTWQKNLRAALETKEVILLHGNVRDWYMDENKLVHYNLTEILQGIVSAPNFPLHFTRSLYYDISQREKRIGDAGLERAQSPRNSEFGSAPSAQKGAPQIEPVRLLAKWADELKHSTNTLAILYYLDKLISYQSHYNETESESLFWLEKIIENIAPTNRLILVALQDSQVPTEVYTFAPKVQLVGVPMPDQQDRFSYLSARLSQGRGKDYRKLISDLTDGLYLVDLENIIKSLPQNLPGEGELRRLINKYRIGEQQDFWGAITLDALKRAFSTFINDEEYGVKGQNQAVQRVVDVITVAKAGLAGIASDSTAKPKGILVFVGPSGVGKTFLAKKLARFLFSSEEAFLRYDMSEFKEEHTISKLIGSPPGYVGYEQGGKLTNDVRQRPFSVILFDEIEKAHPKIMDIFLQILDDGRLTDSRGQTVFFSEAVIIFTSNIGTRTHDSRGQAVTERFDLEKLVNKLEEAERKGQPLDAIQKEISMHFTQAANHFFADEISRPELLNRIGNNIVPFNYISQLDVQKEIVDGHLRKVASRYTEQFHDRKLRVVFEESVAENMVEMYHEQIAEFGGRAITNIIQDSIMPLLARRTLGAVEKNSDSPVTFHVRVGSAGVEIVD